MKNILPRAGFEPVMPRVGRDLKQWSTKWNAIALPLSYQAKTSMLWPRHHAECF